jgi:hypothetical protein
MTLLKTILIKEREWIQAETKGERGDETVKKGEAEN